MQGKQGMAGKADKEIYYTFPWILHFLVPALNIFQQHKKRALL